MKILIILLDIAFGTALGFWHRNLMVCLNATHPDVWKALGREDFTGLFWPLSLRAPIWSWSSIFFFITKKYEKMGDPRFAGKAQWFRLVFVAWMMSFFGMLFLLFWLD